LNHYRDPYVGVVPLGIYIAPAAITALAHKTKIIRVPLLAGAANKAKGIAQGAWNSLKDKLSKALTPCTRNVHLWAAAYKAEAGSLLQSAKEANDPISRYSLAYAALTLADEQPWADRFAGKIRDKPLIGPSKLCAWSSGPATRALFEEPATIMLNAVYPAALAAYEQLGMDAPDAPPELPPQFAPPLLIPGLIGPGLTPTPEAAPEEPPPVYYEPPPEPETKPIPPWAWAVGGLAALMILQGRR